MRPGDLNLSRGQADQLVWHGILSLCPLNTIQLSDVLAVLITGVKMLIYA